MAVPQRITPRPASESDQDGGARASRGGMRARRGRLSVGGVGPLASPGQIAVIYRWGTWLLALGLIVSGTSASYGAEWARRGDLYVLLGLTLLVNVLITFALRPYVRLMRRYPAIMVLDVFFCLGIYAASNIWTSPFQFYSYAALMLPVTIFFYGGALAGSLLFLVLDVLLLYQAGDTLSWARAGGFADTYFMQLAIVPLLAFVFAYPNRLYAQLRRAQRRLDQVEREQLLIGERTRIAQSLHDSVAQMLFGIGMLAESALVRLASLTTPATAQPAGDANPSADAATSATAQAQEASERGALAGALSQMRDLATRGNQEMRRAIYALHEPITARRGLVAGLRDLLAESGARTGLDTHLTVLGASPDIEQADASAEQPPTLATNGAATGTGAPEDESAMPAATTNEDADEPAVDDSTENDPLRALPEPVAGALYKVAREALANVEKHALAFNVWVEVGMRAAAGSTGTGSRPWAELTVRDDGQGFRRALLSPLGLPDEDEDGLMHFGTGNMRRDIEAVGGTITTTSAPGRGTTVRATAPLG